MTAAMAFEVLRRAAIKGEVSQEIAEAVGVASDHVRRLEQTLDLIESSVRGALADKPENALLRRCARLSLCTCPVQSEPHTQNNLCRPKTSKEK